MSSILPTFDPVIPPSRLYMYFYHEKMPPWGISWDLIRNSPHLLLMADVQVDRYAQDAEENTRKKLGWISGDIHRTLRKKNVIKPHDFEAKIRAIARDKPLIRNDVKARIDTIIKTSANIDEPQNDPNTAVLPRLFHELSAIDHDLLPTICGEEPTVYDFMLAPQISPSWITGAEEVLRLFLDSNFRLLPQVTDLPSDKQSAMKECIAEVTKLQRKPMYKLATGVYDYKEYQDELVSLGERKNYDYLMDAMMENYEDPLFNGLNYSDKLGRLLDVRKTFVETFREIIRDKSFSETQRRSRLDDEIKNHAKRFLLTEEEGRKKLAAGGAAAIVAYVVAFASPLSTIPPIASIAEKIGDMGLGALAFQYAANRFSNINTKDLQYRIGAAKVTILRNIGDPTKQLPEIRSSS